MVKQRTAYNGGLLQEGWNQREAVQSDNYEGIQPLVSSIAMSTVHNKIAMQLFPMQKLYLAVPTLRAPPALRKLGCKLEDLEYYTKQYEESESKTQTLIHKHLVPAATKIQRQYRLWQWRKLVVWNPHTEFGRLNALIQYRCVANFDHECWVAGIFAAFVYPSKYIRYV